MFNVKHHPAQTLFARFVLLLFLGTLALCALPAAARAQDGWDARNFRTISDDCGPFLIGRYEAQDSSVSYCMNQDRFGPTVPGGPWLTYDQGWTWLDDAFGAVVCHGYPTQTSFGGHNLSADHARAATQLAVWMITGTTKPDGSFAYTNGTTHKSGSFNTSAGAEIVQAARWLYENAVSGNIKAGKHRARRYTGPISGSQRQDMLYVMPTVQATFEKRSDDTTITTSNGTYKLEGATFDIYESQSETLVGTITFDEAGQAQATLLPRTSYYLVETSAPAGYLPRQDRITFTTSDNGGGTTIDEQPGRVRVRIVKLDAATGGPAQPGASLEGAEFTCVSDSTPGWTRTCVTDAQGTATLDDVPLGSFTLFESRAPEGYLPSSETWSYTVGSEQMGESGVVELECRVSDTPISCDLEISKFKDHGDSEESGIEQPAGGVTFEVVSNSTGKTVGTLTTNVYGYASTADSAGVWLGAGERPSEAHGAIPYDRAGYTVHEVESTVPEGFRHVGDWTISAEQLIDGTKLQYIVDNHAILTHLQIVKRDAASDATVPLAGFSFQVLDCNRNPISQTVWHPNHRVSDTFTTDATGSVTLPQSLKPGEYYLRESAAAAPYLLAEDLPFTIPADEALTPVVIASFRDRRATGRLSIHKSDANNDTDLAGATFDVRAVDDIVEPDGTIFALAGQTVATVTTKEDGTATAEQLSLGAGEATYEVIETQAPDGYLVDSTPQKVTLTYQDNATPVMEQRINMTNDYTKVDISKVDATGASEIPGAKLTLVDAKGEIVESWTSTETPHRIEHLSPGTYTLREEMTPRTYDMAEEILFELEATGKVQTVAMQDEPLHINGSIDKRQEIAQPLDSALQANGDGKNQAEAQLYEDGSYRYTIDARNDSGTWVDECTVTDELQAVVDGAAELISVQTPIATGDYDGKLNVWYRTDRKYHDQTAGSDNDNSKDADGEELDGSAEEANATLDDGHDNPWLSTDEVKELLGDDKRGVDYSEWRLWKRDISATEASELEVSELNLRDGEHVVGIRFEYGRVSEAFTTRDDGSLWTRENLKDDHDDIESADVDDSNTLQGAVMQMRATSGYIPQQPLENKAEIALYRNGGGEELEAHDSDQVVQRCKATGGLPLTGSAPVAAVVTALLTTGAFAVYMTRTRRH